MLVKLYYILTSICAAGIAAALWNSRSTLSNIARRVSAGTAGAAVLGLFFDSNYSLFLTIAAGASLAFFLGLPVAWLLNKIFGGGGSSADHLRGAAIADARQVARQVTEKSRFDIGGVPVPISLETRSFLLAGSPGTGKSQALTRALDSLIVDGARGVIADASGIYLSRYFDERRGDVILNPFDARGVSWSPLAEIETPADIPALVKSLIPDAEGAEARTWSGYAQTALDAILEYVYSSDKATNGEIFRLSTSADLNELRQVFDGTPAAALVQEGNERMFASVRGTMSEALQALRYLDPDAGIDAFSIRRHIAEERKGWIFLSYQQQHRSALSRLIGACLDIAARAVLSLPPDLNRRVIFALDELPLLGKVQSLIDLLTNGRKHGAVIFAGIQTIAQLRENYGYQTSQTLLACLGSWLVLRVSDAETAEYMSKYLGEEEKSRIVQSGGESTSGFFDKSKNENWSQQIVKDRIVLPSELQNLPDLTGYFNLAGPVPTAKVTLQLAEQRAEKAKAFEAAPPRARARKIEQPAQQPQEPAQAESVADAATAETDLPY